MNTAPRRLTAVPKAPGSNTSVCSIVCQTTISGPQQTSVRVLTPVSGPDGPHIAVRLGGLLLLISDRAALGCLSDACTAAEALADRAFGGASP